MGRGSTLAGAVLLALGIFVCHQALNLSLGQASRPGPGFVPFGLGCILILLSLLYLIPSFRSKWRMERSKVHAGLYRIVLAVGILCLFTGFLSWLGYLISTFILFLIWLAFIERKRWYVSFSISLLALVVVYFFNILFSVQLPRGLIQGF